MILPMQDNHLLNDLEKHLLILKKKSSSLQTG
jgi:hypothetical protein